MHDANVPVGRNSWQSASLSQPTLWQRPSAQTSPDHEPVSWPHSLSPAQGTKQLFSAVSHFARTSRAAIAHCLSVVQPTKVQRPPLHV